MCKEFDFCQGREIWSMEPLSLLSVTERALAKNYRSYGAWYHRKWVLSKGHSSVDRELQLLGVFLKKNSRNFHAWNYRRFVAALKNRSDAEELHFTTDFINENFSNYSSWHNRSVILSHLLKKKAQESFSKEKVLTEEYDLVHQALFTDPDDQTDGFLDTCASSPVTGFHLNSGIIPLILYFNEAVEGVSSSTIIVQSVHDTNKDLIWSPQSTNNSGSSQAWVTHLTFHEENLQSLQTHPVKEPTQIKIFDQLRNSEVNESTASKWSAETIVNEIALYRELLSEINCKTGKLMRVRLLTAHDALMSHAKTAETCKMVHTEEVKELCSDLMTLDPPHSQYYKDEYSLVVLKQVDISSLLYYCVGKHSPFRDSASSGTNDYICLQLNNLSLSHIGSIEKLLWVQMLDLSHNQLSSIEGLQAMQLLSCLNPSNNKMGSFSALEPLKLLKSLEVLDISYNEIGAHVVDTRSIGNVVAEEEFKLFLLNILHALNWLDGVELH
ncbi:hypothetical protein TEA_011997 [Camellia sinensis var. sinensis]|uniref:Geranylgeranyl transferase type-2 subunit alpha n=1 Tax=Camellia sinensis var. sinensis TaxID=542762 RepID=A0A4S4D287_CAMSN|nr:hypothetical protein TEA_011997 [Camellia sinensis var. sinensis]